MRLGFYTDYSERIAEFAQQVGFTSMELSAWPISVLNADTVTDQRLTEIRKDLDRRDIQVSALGYYPNYLSPDRAEREEAQRYFLKVLDLAVRMEVPVVATFAGRDPYKSVADNLPLFKEVFSRFCDEAERRNLKIAIENCPMAERGTMLGTNIAFSPEIWDAMFEAVPSKALGLEMDPSHLVWLGIDYIQAIYDYGDRIYHVHAKDVEIDRKLLARVGIYGQVFGDVFGLGHGWWRGRAPGWGEVNWPRFVTALIEIGYQGNLDIEHEDVVLAQAAQLDNPINNPNNVAQLGREEKGLILGYKTLSQLVVQSPERVPST